MGKKKRKTKDVLEGVFVWRFLGEAHGKGGRWFVTFVPRLFLASPFVANPAAEGGPGAEGQLRLKPKVLQKPFSCSDVL